MVPNRSIKGYAWKKPGFLVQSGLISEYEALKAYFNAPKTIIVTGTPGTGKTRYAKELSLLIRAKYIDGTKIGKKISKEWDNTLNTAIVSIPHFIREIKDIVNKHHKSAKKTQNSLKTGKKHLIIDSHLSHYISPKMADFCIILRLESLKTLKNRLEKRGYSAQKVRDNIDSEIFQVCRTEAIDIGHDVIIVDGNKKNQASLFYNSFKHFF
jgi:adenylate kinase